ncbi:hypothetical protein ACERC8_07610 [Streptococcus sp. E29BA]|uniref:hypothetical protein n=1 Tax=Streptococcus sp. E29BA TaxID=3278716 RepID=UPI00359DCC16
MSLSPFNQGSVVEGFRTGKPEKGTATHPYAEVGVNRLVDYLPISSTITAANRALCTFLESVFK